jgi:hypothetical protein
MNYQVVINCCYGGFTLSDKALNWLADRGLKLETPYPTLKDLPRHHPLLVECINALGDKASGDMSKLVVYSVAGKYRVTEYDGFESIETPGNINWIDPTV